MSIHQRRLVGVGCESGKTLVYGFQSGGHFYRNSMMLANWTGMRSSPMAHSPRQKKGFRSRKDQTRKGYKAYGGGRRPGCASRSPTYLGVATRVYTDRTGARTSGCAASRTWSSA